MSDLEPQMNRRSFLGFVGLGLAGLAGLIGFWTMSARHALARAGAGPLRSAKNPAKMTPLERAHTPEVQFPRVAEDGSDVPILIDMAHEQRPGDYIKTIEIFNYNDPIPSKGTYHFTPANGRVHLSLHTRMDRGRARVFVVAECTRHGRWITKMPIEVKKGGC